MPFSKQISLGFLLAILFVVVLMGTINLLTVERALDKQGLVLLEGVVQNGATILELQQILVSEKLGNEIHLLDSMMEHLGTFSLDEKEIQSHNVTHQVTKASESIELPALKLGKTTVYNNFELVDSLKSKANCTATIFQLAPGKMVRISTNVTKEDGSRAIDTYIPEESPVYQKIAAGEEYHGRALVVGNWLLAVYKPIFDKEGKVIGASYVGESMFSDSFKNALLKNPLEGKGEIFLADEDGKILLHSQTELEGKSLHDLEGGPELMATVDTRISYRLGGITKEAFVRQNKEWNWRIGFAMSQEEIRLNMTSQLIWLSLISGLLALAMGYIMSRVLIHRLRQPITNLAGVMSLQAEGQMDLEIPETERQDEIGQMARAAALFKHKSEEMLAEQEARAQQDRLTQVEQERLDQQRREEKQRMVKRLTQTFKEGVGKMLESLALASEAIGHHANEVALAAKNTREGTDNASAAVSSASDNVTQVASATEELSQSIHEIGRQVNISSTTASQAMGEAAKTRATISELADNVLKIGEVVGLIQKIAGQTNLLALNATIEAARAGEAGKGFSVVASEVKNLAIQTGKATEEISKKIHTIQTETHETVAVIANVGKIIDKINEISKQITAAVVEQSDVAQEIARNVYAAAEATKQSSRSVESVKEVAKSADAASKRMLQASNEMDRTTNALSSEVDEFLQQLQNMN